LKIEKQKLNFPNPGGEILSALLEKPSGKIEAFVLFAHCFTCSKNIGTATRISRALAERGFATLRFDFTGLGNSEGDFSNTNFSSNVDDLVAAASYLATAFEAPKILIGHSLGGAAVIAAAARLPDVQAVVTIAAPSDPAHMRYLLRDSVPEIMNKGRATVEIGGQKFTIRKQFLEDVSEQNLDKVLKNLARPLLIMHSPRDKLIDIEHAYHLFDVARCPKSFISLDSADHLLSNPDDATYAAETIAAWASRYVQ
jgi:alpha-beta hydrolase superfamily lysophospholipase